MKDLINLYQELYNLIGQERALILNNSYDHLPPLLEEKQQLINQIDEINKKDFLEGQSNPEEALANLSKLITDLKVLEDKNIAELQNRKQTIRNKLLNISKGQKSRKFYYARNRYEAKFIDEKG